MAGFRGSGRRKRDDFWLCVCSTAEPVPTPPSYRSVCGHFNQSSCCPLSSLLFPLSFLVSFHLSYLFTLHLPQKTSDWFIGAPCQPILSLFKDPGFLTSPLFPVFCSDSTSLHFDPASSASLPLRVTLSV